MLKQTQEQRGQALFAKKIESLPKAYQQFFLEHFDGMISVMPINGMFSASRLAEACIAVVDLECPLSDAGKQAILAYSANNAEPATIRRSINPGMVAETRDADEETVNADPNRSEKISDFDEMNQQITLTVAQDECDLDDYVVEHIDITGDTPVDILTVEGYRSRNLITADFDVEKDTVGDIQDNRLRLHLPQAYSQKNGGMPSNFKIKCPACQSTDTLPSYNDECSCMSCDVEFVIEYDL